MISTKQVLRGFTAAVLLSGAFVSTNAAATSDNISVITHSSAQNQTCPLSYNGHLFSSVLIQAGGLSCYYASDRTAFRRDGSYRAVSGPWVNEARRLRCRGNTQGCVFFGPPIK